ncbi:MAG TPA: glycosyltransferase [Candidatus Aphodousia faecavium]|nr:glycosyltransferase [Candidatus Aphodousia faecavium]
MSTTGKKLNIVLLTSTRFHKSKGGTEKVMIDTANAMTARGHKVKIIFRDNKGSEPGFILNDSVELINCAKVKTPMKYLRIVCDIRSMSISKEKRNYKRALLNLKTEAYRFKEAIESTDADIYVTYDPKLTAMLQNEFGIKKPVVTTFQFDPEHIFRRYYFNTIKTMISKVGPVQVLLPIFEKKIKSQIPDVECITIPNAVQPFEVNKKLDSKVILNIARVMPLKNQKLIAEAMLLVNQKYPNWKVRIVGEDNVDPDYSNSIKTYLNSHGLQDIVYFCGPKDDISEEFLKCSIFVFPSISEGFGLALAESMSAGLPCVGLKACSAVSCLIRNNQNGILCDNSAESLANALIQLISDRDLRLRLGSQAQKDMQEYLPEVIWQKWENLFLSLVRR